MKKENTAHFEQVKEQNKRLVRNFLRNGSAWGIGEVSEKTGLSYPTVSALLKELQKTGEVLLVEEKESRGGRPGAKYRLNEAFQYALVLYFSDWILKGEVYDARGIRTEEHYTLQTTGEVTPEEIAAFIGTIRNAYPAITAVSIGIPGAANETEITHLPKFAKLVGRGLAEKIESELNVKVFIENDVNAVAFSETDAWSDFAHIVYVEEDTCIGVGIVLRGEIVRGCRGFAGELEYLCGDMENREETFVRSILALVCVLNLPDILVSGTYCTEEHMKQVELRLREILPAGRLPEIHIVEDMEGYYEKGLLKKVMVYWEGQIGTV